MLKRLGLPSETWPKKTKAVMPPETRKQARMAKFRGTAIQLLDLTGFAFSLRDEKTRAVPQFHCIFLTTIRRSICIMNTNSILSSAVLAAGIIAAGFALPAAAADQNGGDTHTGSATVKLQYVHGVHQNGSPDLKHDAACKKQLSEVTSKFVGMPVKTDYSIDPKTLMMSAKSMFPSPVATQPLELTVNLNPLGIKGVYAFGAFRPAELKDAYVLFSISEKFTDAKSTFLIINPKQDYNCVISSAKAPFKTAESAKLGIDQK